VHNFCAKEYADYCVKYEGPGGTIKAYHQNGGPHDGLFIAKDNFGHGGSSFKLLEEASGNKLRLIADLNSEGIIMTGKHSSNLGELYKYFGKRIL